MVKTENPLEVGKHAFEVAGLGAAPFRFIGLNENRITYPDGSSKAGGSCDYCGTSIALECWCRSSDGRKFKVGCDCIRKVGDDGLLRAYKTSPEFRAHQRAIKAEKDAAVLLGLRACILADGERMATMPHPLHYTDRQTGAALTLLDWARWMADHCGAAGRAAVLRRLKYLLA